MTIIGATDSSMDLRFPWAADTDASYRVLSSSSLTDFLSVTHTLESRTNIAPGIEELTIRSVHPASRVQFSQLEIVVPGGP